MISDTQIATEGRTLGIRRDGISWSVAVLAALGVSWAMAASAVAAPAATESVIVIEKPHAGSLPEQAVKRLGGHVDRQLPIINGFSATLPAGATAKLRTARGVKAVSANRRLRSYGYLPGSNYENTSNMNSLYNSIRVLGGEQYWLRGYTGAGIDVALIDTGVTKVPGLDAPGKVIDGPDLSFESQDPNRRYKDMYGHGTHLAGLIAGNDTPGKTGPEYAADATSFIGIAPDARIVNMKVADGKGVADVSQVIAAIDWVVQHRNTDGLNIRVMEIAFGSDSTQDYSVDPLAYATEVAMAKGITVVVAAGNSGKHTPGPGLADPAYHPRAIAVGASDSKGTQLAEDDQVPSFSSSAPYYGGRGPDVLAPGVSIPSLRAPTSMIDTAFGPYAAVGPRFMKGTGTSQASALVAGAAALFIQERPTVNHDKVKATFRYYSKPLLNEPVESQGRGVLQLDWMLGYATRRPPTVYRTYGGGSIDLARGTRRAQLNNVAISGEVDIMGKPFNSYDHAYLADLGSSWSGGAWNGSSWSGSSWSGSSWSGSSWSGSSWSGSTWSGSTWSTAAWY